jgi:hypothetical protein
MKRLKNRLNDLQEVALLLKMADVSVDLITLLCGKKIGVGGSRAVYEFNLNHKYVIKVEPHNTDSNITEAMIWEEVQGLKGDLAWVKDWFAPIHFISPNGKVLIMERTQVKVKEKPKKIPSFFMDAKPNNFGWIGNKYVCHDYGIIYGFIKYRNKFTDINWAKDDN